jgi:hypothetical protein
MYIDPKPPANIRSATTVGVHQPTGQAGHQASLSDEGADGVQLSHLSSVLNSLSAGASAGAKQISSLSALFKAGAYQVNPILVSQRIIDDALRPG